MGLVQGFLQGAQGVQQLAMNAERMRNEKEDREERKRAAARRESIEDEALGVARAERQKQQSLEAGLADLDRAAAMVGTTQEAAKLAGSSEPATMDRAAVEDASRAITDQQLEASRLGVAPTVPPEQQPSASIESSNRTYTLDDFEKASGVIAKTRGIGGIKTFRDEQRAKSGEAYYTALRNAANSGDFTKFWNVLQTPVDGFTAKTARLPDGRLAVVYTKGDEPPQFTRDQDGSITGVANGRYLGAYSSADEMMAAAASKLNPTAAVNWALANMKSNDRFAIEALRAENRKELADMRNNQVPGGVRRSGSGSSSGSGGDSPAVSAFDDKTFRDQIKLFMEGAPGQQIDTLAVGSRAQALMQRNPGLSQQEAVRVAVQAQTNPALVQLVPRTDPDGTPRFDQVVKADGTPNGAGYVLGVNQMPNEAMGVSAKQKPELAAKWWGSLNDDQKRNIVNESLNVEQARRMIDNTPNLTPAQRQSMRYALDTRVEFARLAMPEQADPARRAEAMKRQERAAARSSQAAQLPPEVEAIGQQLDAARAKVRDLERNAPGLAQAGKTAEERRATLANYQAQLQQARQERDAAQARYSAAVNKAGLGAAR